MAYCSNCGSSVDGRFCPKCGAAAPSPTAGETPPFQQPSQPGMDAQAPGLPDNVAAALCYTLFGGILFLVLEPYNRKREIRFHAWQAIFLFCGLFVFYSCLSIFVMILPNILAFLIGTAILLSNLLVFLLWLYLLIRTFNGQKTVLPIIGPLAERQAG